MLKHQHSTNGQEEETPFRVLFVGEAGTGKCCLFTNINLKFPSYGVTLDIQAYQK